jgi:hypothetical protein
VVMWVEMILRPLVLRLYPVATQVKTVTADGRNVEIPMRKSETRMLLMIMSCILDVLAAVQKIDNGIWHLYMENLMIKILVEIESIV